MSSASTTVLADLAAEGDQLDGWVSPLPEGDWGVVTTPEGWTVAHQVGHLAWTDEATTTAIADPDAFTAGLDEVVARAETFVDDGANEWAELPPPELLERWRSGRARLNELIGSVPDGRKIPWYGPPMSATSMATARMMETWTHARDVAAALRIEAPRDDRCRHVCHLGVRTRGFAHVVRGEQPPEGDVHVALTGPSGDLWTWGPEDAPERVTGSAYDFALLVTRRRHVDDVDVEAEGEHARHWLTIAQAFAGLPGRDPARLADRSGS